MNITVAWRSDRIQYAHLIKIVLIFCAGWAGIVFATCTAQAAGIVGDGSPGSCTETALDVALVDGGVVTFNCGPAPHTINVTSEMVIATNTDVDGGGLLILSGDGATRVFNVNAGVRFDLANLTIREGNASGAEGGGGLLNNGTTTVTAVGFVNNIANVGGGIANKGILTVVGSTFSGNIARPGMAYTGGGGIVNGVPNSPIGILTISKSTFSDNVSDYTGGALQNFGSATVTDSAFTGNSALYQFGGGLTNYGHLTLSGSTFTGNSAGINGGAIDTIIALTVTTSSFVNNFAYYRGGAINNYLGTITVSHSAFSGNSVNAYGGGLTNDGGTAYVSHSTFTGNAAKEPGGGIANDGWLTIHNSTFSGNTTSGSIPSDDNGGGLSSRNTLGGNNGVVVINSTFVGNTASNLGGNLYNEDSSITLRNTLIANGTPANCAGVITSHGHNLDSSNSCGFAALGDQINRDPVLGPLQDNGGLTQTQALLAGSPAIDAANPEECPAADQRGWARVGICDIGSYEYPLQMYLPLAPGNFCLWVQIVIPRVSSAGHTNC